MPIQKFDKPTCRRVGESAIAALKPLAESLGLALEHRGGRYTEGTYLLKVEFAVRADREGRSARESEFAQFCVLYGLEPSDYGRTFCVLGKQYRLVEIAPNRRKFPFVGERVIDGRKFKFPASAVVRELKGPEAAERFLETDFERRVS